jgi:hypothetical protein
MIVALHETASTECILEIPRWDLFRNGSFSLISELMPAVEHIQGPCASQGPAAEVNRALFVSPCSTRASIEGC